MSFTMNAGNDQRSLACAPSLLAVCIGFALTPVASFAASTSGNDETLIVEGGSGTERDSHQDHDYSVQTTTTGTKLLLVPRDIPQSVSVISQQRIQDQNLNAIGQVLTNTTGVTAQVQDRQSVV